MRLWTLAVRLGVLVAAIVAAIAFAAATVGVADSPDIPVALDIDRNYDELYVAMRSETGGLGGIARMAPDCREISRWTTGRPLDTVLAHPRAPEGGGVWVLEDAGTPGDPARRVTLYSRMGDELRTWPVDDRAVRMDVYSTQGLFVLLEAAYGLPARVAWFEIDGAEKLAWNVEGDARDLAVLGQSMEQAVYVVAERRDEYGGRLLRYTLEGDLETGVALDQPPAAVGLINGLDVFVYGRASKLMGSRSRVTRFAVRGSGEDTSWEVDDQIALDIDVSYGRQVWTAGLSPGAEPPATLRLFDYDGQLVAACTQLPQPSVPTPQPGECPDPVSGRALWSFDASGAVSGAPAIGEDSTTYFGTKSGLLYAIACDGTKRWVFDYRDNVGSGGAQAFEGSPAVDEDGTIYIGDDIVTPNYFFAIGPDGRARWVREFQGTYSQIDTSPAIGPTGLIYAGSHGWGAGVSFGCILTFDRAGRWVRPSAGGWCDRYVGPITSSPAVLESGAAVFAAPKYSHWTNPTTTPATPVPPASATPTGTPPTATTAPPLPTMVYFPYTAVDGTAWALAAEAPASGAERSSDDPNQPRPPPWVTEPVPARLHLVYEHPVQATAVPDLVVDLDDLDLPSSLAADGEGVWFTAAAPDGPRLVRFTFADPPRRTHEILLPGFVAGSPILGRRDGERGLTEVLVMSATGRLMSLEVPDEGRGPSRELWSRMIGQPAQGAPALGNDGRVYVAAGQVAMALDRRTGGEVWSVQLDADVSGSVQLAPGGVMYVGTTSGTLWAIGTDATGLDTEALWPVYRRNARNTGAIGAP